MIRIGDEAIEPGIHVVIWLREAVRQPPLNRDEWSPALRLQPALRAASSEDCDRSLLCLFDALAESDDDFRRHLLHALQGFTSEELIDRYVQLLPPRPARWLIAPPVEPGFSMPELVFNTISNGPHLDPRLKPGMLTLGGRVLSDVQLLRYCVSYYARNEGIDLAREHAGARKPLDSRDGWSMGLNFGLEAPEYLPELAELLRPYQVDVRLKFLEGAGPRQSNEELAALAVALDL